MAERERRPAPRHAKLPGPAAARARPSPTGLLQLQQRAGNVATTSLVSAAKGAGVPAQAGATAVPALMASSPPTGGVTAQRGGDDGEKPVDKALRTKDPGAVKALDRKDIAGLPAEKRMDLVRVLAYQGWVGPFDESKIEEIWGTLSTRELVAVGSREILMFNHCIDVGAELETLPNVKLVAGDFVSDTRSVAMDYLKQNEDLVRAEMTGLGIPAKADEPAAPATSEQSEKLAEIQRAAASVADLKKRMEEFQQLAVGYGPARNQSAGGSSAGSAGGAAPPSQGTTEGSNTGSAGGVGRPGQHYYADVSLFEPDKPPQFTTPEQATAAGLTFLAPPTGQVRDFDTLNKLHAQATATVGALLGAHPAVMALTKTGKADEVGAFATEKNPAAARAQVGAAMRGVLDNIALARSGLTVGSGDINPLDLEPIHRQLFAGQARAKGTTQSPYDWTQTFPQAVAGKLTKDHAFAKVMDRLALETLTQAAFLIAPFTGGASLAVLLAVGVGAAAAQTKFSKDEYDNMLAMSRSSVKKGTELVDQGQVDAAKAQLEADELDLAMTAITAASLGLSKVPKYKDLAKAIDTATDAVGLLMTYQELTAELGPNVSMAYSMVPIDLPAAAPVQQVQRVGEQAVWESFEIHASGQLQSGTVAGIPKMDIVLPGIHNTSGNGIDRIGLRKTASGQIEVWHFEMKWNYLETTNPDPKLWERGARIQFDKNWEARALDQLAGSDHPSALAARDSVRMWLAQLRGHKNPDKVPMGEVIDLLRRSSSRRAVLYREGVVPTTLLEQLARLLRRGRSVRHAPVKLPR